MTLLAPPLPDGTVIDSDGTVSVIVTGAHDHISSLVDVHGQSWELPEDHEPVQLSVDAAPSLQLTSKVTLSAALFYSVGVNLDNDNTHAFANALRACVDHYTAGGDPVPCAIINATDNDGTPVIVMVKTSADDTISIAIVETSDQSTYLVTRFGYTTIQNLLLPDLLTAVIPYLQAPIVDIALDTEGHGRLAILRGHDFPKSSAVVVTAPEQPAMWTGLDEAGYSDLLHAFANPVELTPNLTFNHTKLNDAPTIPTIEGTNLNGQVVELTVEQTGRLNGLTVEQPGGLNKPTLLLTIHDSTNDCLAEISMNSDQSDDDVVAPMQAALYPDA